MRGNPWMTPIMLVGDLFWYFVSYEAAFYLRFLGKPPEVNHDAFLKILPWLLIALAALHTFYRLYDPHTVWDELAAGVLSSQLFNTVVAVALSFFLRGFAFPRTVFLLALLISSPVLLGWRRFLYVTVGQAISQKVIVVGPGEEAEAVARCIASTRPSPFRVVGVLASEVGTSAQTVVETAVDREASAILLCAGLDANKKTELLEEAYRSGLEVLVIPDVPEILLASARREKVDDFLLLRVGDVGSRWDPVKRLFDIALASLGLILALPVMALVALAIRLESPGPVIYRQTRLTAGGRHFTLYKFRTMYDGAEARTGPTFSHTDDPRVTRVGRFLRSTRLDELPQLWNVIRGDMSLVGPRPERPHFVEQFIRDLPHYALRYRVRAGITGLAQVNGRYSTNAAEKLRFDLLYVQGRSPVLDLSILLETIRTVLTRGRAS